MVNPLCSFPLTLSANFIFQFVIYTFISNSVFFKILFSGLCSAVGAKLSEKHTVTRIFPEDWGSRFF